MSTCNESCLKVHEEKCYSIWRRHPPHNEVPWYLMLPCPKVTLGVLREEHPKSLGVAPWRTFFLASKSPPPDGRSISDPKSPTPVPLIWPPSWDPLCGDQPHSRHLFHDSDL